MKLQLPLLLAFPLLSTARAGVMNDGAPPAMGGVDPSATPADYPKYTPPAYTPTVYVPSAAPSQDTSVKSGNGARGGAWAGAGAGTGAAVGLAVGAAVVGLI